MCLPSGALLQHLPSYLGFSYLGRGVSLHGCSSKAQPLLLTLDKVASPELERGVAPLHPPVPVQLPLLGCGLAPFSPDFPGGSDSKSICLQCRRPRFDPWVVKIPWRGKWQPTPVFLPGKSHGQKSLASYSPWGHTESDTTERLHFTSLHYRSAN